jgi:hypothetical protein
MNKVTVLAGQNLYDVAIQHCGSAEAIHDIARINRLSVTDILPWGTEILIPLPVNKRVVSFLAKDKWQPSTVSQFTEPFGIGFDFIEIDLEVA